ncbi:hypothetical protein [Catellatospora sp. NPDC049133]|uniref:hypothetical protein n=1 Tax=Catellatospora sp. NPDC049133 TaxID=3155499 RepID=UPI0033F0AEF1
MTTTDWRRAATGALALAAALGLAGCTGDSGAAPAATASPTANPAISPELPRYVAAADEANVQGPATVIRAGARPTVVDDNGRVQAMVMRDESRTTFTKGNYRLTVYCVGTGTLYAHFAIGGVSKIEELPTCDTARPTVSSVELSLPADAADLSVIIMPIGDAQAGVAYQVQRQ